MTAAVERNMGNKQSNIIICTTDDGAIKIETTIDGGTIWMSKAQMAELFRHDRPAISKFRQISV